MFDYSSLIVEATKYVDKKIEKLNPKGVDRNRLHNKIIVQIVANIKRIAALEQSSFYKEIDSIFNSQLLEEVSKNL